MKEVRALNRNLQVLLKLSLVNVFLDQSQHKQNKNENPIHAGSQILADKYLEKMELICF